MSARSASLDFRHALSQFATGVTIVTTMTADGTPVGMTANSFSSVSLAPPLVLWSIALTASSLPAFRAAPRYLVHVLAHDQLALAQTFAKRGADKFAHLEWTATAAGLPRLAGCVAWFDCLNHRQHEEGDHVVLIGRVDNFTVVGGAPLIFHAGRYITEATEAPLPAALLRPI